MTPRDGIIIGKPVTPAKGAGTLYSPLYTVVLLLSAAFGISLTATFHPESSYTMWVVVEERWMSRHTKFSKSSR
jgi:hypothetical protein